MKRLSSFPLNSFPFDYTSRSNINKIVDLCDQSILSTSIAYLLISAPKQIAECSVCPLSTPFHNRDGGNLPQLPCISPFWPNFTEHSPSTAFRRHRSESTISQRQQGLPKLRSEVLSFVFTHVCVRTILNQHFRTSACLHLIAK